MKLKFITCSGANETTDINGLISLIEHFPQLEIGVQVSGKKCAFGSKRYAWIFELARCLQERKVVPKIALHINSDWVERFCAGDTVAEIERMLALKNCQGRPFISRLQLNFKIGREKAPDLDVLTKIMAKYSTWRFILSFNASNAGYIRELYTRGLSFDILCDSSFGEGVIPDERPDLIFADVLQGYAGGLSAENVAAELQKLAAKLPAEAEIYIDAEGKLKNAAGHFDLAKARLYIENALNWDKSH